MKKILALILAIILCLSLCACGERNVTSPGTADDETTDKSDNNGVSENTDNSDSVNDTSDDQTNDNDSSDTQNNSNNNVDNYTEAPAADATQSIKTGNLDIDISYSNGMQVTEQQDDKTTVIKYSEGCTLYIKDVTGEFDPNKADPSSFLYEYAYERCVEYVSKDYGEIVNFNGEFTISVAGNELYGYGAHMTCEDQLQIYAFIKLVSLDDGYAVTIGVCDEANMNVFDNVELG